MKKEIRTELRDLKKQKRGACQEFNVAMSLIRNAHKQLVRDEKIATRIFYKRTARINRRQAILEGRLS